MESDLVSIENVACPHSVPALTPEVRNGVTYHYRVNSHWPVTWKYKTSDEIWNDSTMNGVYTLPGKASILLEL